MKIKIVIKDDFISIYGAEQIYEDALAIIDYGANIKIQFEKEFRIQTQNYRKSAIKRLTFLKE